MRLGIDVTDDYLRRATPGIGSITQENGYDEKSHNEETSMSEWILRTFGGEIVLITDIGGTYHGKRPDFLWNNKFWELKTVGSEKAT
ncbi:MAG: hypothetical protein IJP92_00255, partial [Lachnospiraceae bacterium]|nr:hypothetical protein [Lachnospiraceae bacterium]